MSAGGPLYCLNQFVVVHALLGHECADGVWVCVLLSHCRVANFSIRRSLFCRSFGYIYRIVGMYVCLSVAVCMYIYCSILNAFFDFFRVFNVLPGTIHRMNFMSHN